MPSTPECSTTLVVQAVRFVVDDRPAHSERWITVSAVDAQLVVKHLPAGAEIAVRIANASRFDSPGESDPTPKTVDVGLGEDQMLLDAFALIERRGPLSEELVRLRKELEARVLRES